MPRSLTNAYWIHVGELRERERIIALLEEEADRNYEYPGDYEVYYGITAILPLIKGENK